MTLLYIYPENHKPVIHIERFLGDHEFCSQSLTKSADFFKDVYSS